MSESDRVQYKFMIPASLKAKLEDAAHANRRSLSSEIIARLDDSLITEQLAEVATESAIKPPSPQELRRMAEIIVILQRHALDEEQDEALENYHSEAASKPRIRKPKPMPGRRLITRDATGKIKKP